jgi:hypothetical protein
VSERTENVQAETSEKNPLPGSRRHHPPRSNVTLPAFHRPRALELPHRRPHPAHGQSHPLSRASAITQTSPRTSHPTPSHSLHSSHRLLQRTIAPHISPPNPHPLRHLRLSSTECSLFIIPHRSLFVIPQPSSFVIPAEIVCHSAAQRRNLLLPCRRPPQSVILTLSAVKGEEPRPATHSGAPPFASFAQPSRPLRSSFRRRPLSRLRAATR